MPKLIASNLTLEQFEVVRKANIEKLEKDISSPPKSFDQKILIIFKALGIFVVNQPIRIIFSCIIFAVLCLMGVFSPTMTFESRAEYLFVPQDSLAFTTYQYEQKTFTNVMVELVLVEPADGVNFLSKTFFDAMWELDTSIRSINQDDLFYNDFCLSINNVCTVLNPLQFWMNENDYLTSVMNDEDIKTKMSSLTFANGGIVSREALFGTSYIENKTNGNIISIEATQFVYQIDTSLISESKINKWESKFLKVCGIKGSNLNPKLKQQFNSLRIVPFGFRTRENEMFRTIFADIPLIILEYIGMFIFIAIVLSIEQTETKICQALGSVFSVVLSTMAGYGFCALCGVPMSFLLLMLPFILVGIGIDDSIVIISAYRNIIAKKKQENKMKQALTNQKEEDNDESIGLNVAEALSHCAMSIIYTTATDVAAFSLGTIGSLPAIRNFCVYAAVCISLDFCFQVTFFVAVLTIDERISARQLKKKKKKQNTSISTPTCLFLTNENDKEIRTDNDVKSNQKNIQDSNYNEIILRESSDKKTNKTKKRNLFSFEKIFIYSKKFVNMISNPYGMMTIMTLYFMLIALNIWAFTHLEFDFDIATIVTDDSYLKQYIDRSTKVGIWDSVITYNVIVKGNKVDIYNHQVQADLSKLLYQDLTENTPKSEGPVSWWLSDYLLWIQTGDNQTGLFLEQYLTLDGYFNGSNSMIAREAFEEGVGKFIQTFPYDRYSTSIHIREDGSIKASRAQLYHHNVISAQNKMYAMRNAYKTCRRSVFGIEKVIPFSQAYIFITQFTIIFRETILNLCLSFVAVAVISMPILYSIPEIMIILLCVTAIDIDLLGLIWLWGYDLNGIIMLSLVLAIGLVVDYIAHILHYFLAHEDKKHNVRLQMSAALAEVGGAVAIGSMTTLFGVLLLAFASSFIFRVFFKLFLSIILLGMFHGFFVAPVMIIGFYDLKAKYSKMMRHRHV